MVALHKGLTMSQSSSKWRWKQQATARPSGSRYKRTTSPISDARIQRPPRFEKLRNIFYQAVVAGAKGFLWFDYGAVANYPEEQAILAPPADEPFTVTPNAPYWHLSRRHVGEHLHLFVASASEKERLG